MGHRSWAVRDEAKAGDMSAHRTASGRGPGPAAPQERLVPPGRGVQLLGCLTPPEAHCERARLEAELREGGRVLPRWTYAPVAHDDLRRALDEAESSLSRGAGPEQALYLARVRELSLEASLCAAAGTSRIGGL